MSAEPNHTSTGIRMFSPRLVLIRWMKRRLVGGLLGGVALVACVGCQTFTLTEEDFQRQQQGEMVDRQTGEVVGVAGAMGYFGALAGEAVAAAVRK